MVRQIHPKKRNHYAQYAMTLSSKVERVRKGGKEQGNLIPVDCLWRTVMKCNGGHTHSNNIHGRI